MTKDDKIESIKAMAKAAVMAQLNHKPVEMGFWAGAITALGLVEDDSASAAAFMKEMRRVLRDADPQGEAPN